jgi:hypothetical protein
VARVVCAASEGWLGWAFIASATMPLLLLSWLIRRKFRKGGLNIK